MSGPDPSIYAPVHAKLLDDTRHLLMITNLPRYITPAYASVLERCEEFAPDPQSGKLLALGTHELHPGSIDLVSPRIGDVHRVSNGLDNEPTISIHVYGANIGAVSRHRYDPATGEQKRFISGYSNDELPNLWDRSDELAP